MPRARLREDHKIDTAVVATLAFATVRGEAPAAAQDQDLHGASAEVDNGWLSEDEDNVDLVPVENKRDAVGFSTEGAEHLAEASRQIRLRDQECSPIAETEDIHPCSTAVKEQDTTARPLKLLESPETTKRPIHTRCLRKC